MDQNVDWLRGSLHGQLVPDK